MTYPFLHSLEPRVFLHAGHHEVGTGLLGEYFASADQTNLLLARAEPAVNFKWGKRAPSPELPKDNFSVRLSGQYMPVTTERYRFRVMADDGVRVAFNGTTVVDRWVGKGRKGWNVFEVDLAEGQKYDLRVDYADRKGKAGVKLLSRTPTMKKWQVVSAGQLFPPPPPPVDPPPVDPPPVDPPPVDPPPVDPPPVDPPPVDPPPVDPPPTGPGPFTQITWSNLAAAPIKRAEALRAVINGKVWVFGGFSDALGPVVRSDVYDPATDTWTQIADLPRRLTHAGVAADDVTDSVYFAGGYVGKPGVTGYSQTFGTTEVWRYDVATNTYAAITPLPAARAGGGLVLVGTNLHYFSGDDLSRNNVTDHYVLNLAALSPTSTWTTAAPLPAGRSHMGYVNFNGHILAIGGQTGNDAGLTTHASVFDYDPAANTWSTRASMPKAVSHISSATFVFRNRIIVAGGETAHNRPVADVFAFDPAANSWATLTSLPAARFSGVADVVADKIIFTGGSSQTTTWLGTPVAVL